MCQWDCIYWTLSLSQASKVNYWMLWGYKSPLPLLRCNSPSSREEDFLRVFLPTRHPESLALGLPLGKRDLRHRKRTFQAQKWQIQNDEEGICIWEEKCGKKQHQRGNPNTCTGLLDPLHLSYTHSWLSEIWGSELFISCLFLYLCCHHSWDVK